MNNSTTSAPSANAGNMGNAIKRGYTRASNSVQRGYSQVKGWSTTQKILGALGSILVILLVIYIIYRIYVSYTGTSTGDKHILISGVHTATKQLFLDSSLVPEAEEGLAMSYSFWINVQDWSYNFGNVKNILAKGRRSGSEFAPLISLYPEENNLHVMTSLFNNDSNQCDIRNIPLQKWVHIVYVLDNRSVSIYIDGKLERNCSLRNIPKLNGHGLTVCGKMGSNKPGFNGLLANLVYYTKALQPEDVFNIYREGP